MVGCSLICTSSDPMRKLLLLAVCLLPLSSCMTSHLVNWVQDESSLYAEPDPGYSKGIAKPFFSFIGFPILFTLDVATCPIQMLFGVYPYGDRYMTPEQVGSKPEAEEYGSGW